MWVWNCIKIGEGTGDGPVMKNMKYSSRKPVFSSQHTHGAAVATSNSSSGLSDLCFYPLQAPTHVLNSLTQIHTPASVVWREKGRIWSNHNICIMRAVSNKRKVEIKTNFLNRWRAAEGRRGGGGKERNRQRRRGGRERGQGERDTQNLVLHLCVPGLADNSDRQKVVITSV